MKEGKHECGAVVYLNYFVLIIGSKNFNWQEMYELPIPKFVFKSNLIIVIVVVRIS